jgi:hypothetical protein
MHGSNLLSANRTFLRKARESETEWQNIKDKQNISVFACGNRKLYRQSQDRETQIRW